MSDDSHETAQNKGIRHQGPDSTSPYPVSRLAAAFEPTDVTSELAEADRHLNTRVSAKLQVLAEQIRSLQDEARRTLEEAQEDHDMHRARCNFQRRPGHTYHLYEKSSGDRYFSMVSPREWRGNPPDTFIGSYRLNPDMSWTPEEKVDQPDEARALVERLLDEPGRSGGPADG